MRKFLDALRGARKIEIFLAIAAIAVLLLQGIEPFGRNSSCTELEQRLGAILCKIEGVGKVEVMVTESADGTSDGVLVVADGAGEISVCLRLQYAIQTLLGVEPSRIEIVPSGG